MAYQGVYSRLPPARAQQARHPRRAHLRERSPCTTPTSRSHHRRRTAGNPDLSLSLSPHRICITRVASAGEIQAHRRHRPKRSLPSRPHSPSTRSGRLPSLRTRRRTPTENPTSWPSFSPAHHRLLQPFQQAHRPHRRHSFTK